MNPTVKLANTQSGFALIIALGLMSFILLLLLAITSFLRVESRAAEQYLRMIEARQNAMMALQIALGELQAAAGPDQRVTAKAGLFNNTHATRRHLTGVWNTNSGNFQLWLVSDFDHQSHTQAFSQSPANPVDADAVMLLGPGSLSSSGGVLTNPEDAVVVRLTDIVIPENDRTSGRYAWWIDDEGVKARINLDNPFLEEGKQPTVLALNSLNRGEVGFLPGFGGWTLGPSQVSRLFSNPHLALAGLDEATARLHFFDFTTWSAGVLADVRDGGLKRDLSLAFELPDNDFNNSVFADSGPSAVSGPGLAFRVQPIFYCPNNGRGPTWHLLRDYYTIYQRIQNPMTDPVFPAQVFSPNNEQLGVEEDNWQSYAAMRFFSNAASAENINGDPLRSTSAPGGNSLRAIPIPIRATYAPYVNRHLINFGVKFTEIASPSGTSVPGWNPNWLVHTPSLWLRPQIILHNPFNVRLSHPGFFTYNDHLRFDVRLRSLLNNEVRTWNLNAGEWIVGLTARTHTQANRHIFRIQSGNIPAGELKIYEGLSDTNNADFSENLIGPYWRRDGNDFVVLGAQSGGIPVVPFDPGDTGPNFQIEFLPFANNHWANWVSHNMGRNAAAIDLSVRTHPSRNFASRTNNLTGSRLQNIIWRDPGSSIGPYQSWWRAGSNLVSQWSGNYMEADGSAPYDFFNFDTYLKPANHLRRYPAFTHTNPLAINTTDVNVFRASNTEWVGYPVLDPGWQIDIYAHSGSGLDIIPSTGGGSNAFWGPNQTQVSNVSLIELPTTPVTSLGKLQNANLAIYGHMPLLAVGNSFASAFIDRRETTALFDNFRNNDPQNQFGNINHSRVFYDLSYLANDALWDGYFFSSYSLPYNRIADAYITGLGARGSFDAAFDPSFDRAGVLRGSLPNSRMQLFGPRESLAEVRDKLFRGNGDPALRGYDRAAENLLVAGSFNIHSTSVGAWQAILSAARNTALYRSGQSGSESYGTNRSPISRLSQPTEGEFDGNPNHRSAWGGFSALTDAQIEALANAIVAELRLRVNHNGRPFMAMADFVNRQLENNAFGLAGLLQAAIDKSGINADFSSFPTSLTGNSANFPAPGNINSADGSSRSAASGATAKILQGTVLQAVGSFLSPRSDTFRIRSYGEVSNPSTGSASIKVWAEAVYQRIPEPVSPRASQPSDSAFWLPQQVDRFGRRFELVSFRWLSEEDI